VGHFKFSLILQLFHRQCCWHWQLIIVGVVVTGNKLIADVIDKDKSPVVNDTGNNLLPVTMTSVKIYGPYH
jgi:hypothetical protein